MMPQLTLALFQEAKGDEKAQHKVPKNRTIKIITGSALNLLIVIAPALKHTAKHARTNHLFRAL